MKRLYLCISLVVLLAAHAVAQVKVTAEIDSTEILIGEQTAVRLQVVHPMGAAVSFPKDMSALLDEKLEVVGNGEIDEHDDTPEKGLATSVYSFKITSFEPSLYYIPRLNVTVDKKNYSSEQLALKVNDVAVDTLNVDKYFGPKEIIEPVYTWGDWMSLLVLSLMLIVCVAGAVFLLYRMWRTKNEKVVKVVREFVLPHQEAKRNIERLKSKCDAGEYDSKDYYTELVAILRNYVSQRYGFSAKEMTSYELVEHLMSMPGQTSAAAGTDGQQALPYMPGGKREDLEELREILRTADLTKFAKLKTEADEDRRNLMRLADYVDTTKNDTQKFYYTPEPDSTGKEKTRNPRLAMKIGFAVLSVTAIVVVFLMVKEVLRLFL